jgi:hypothetical protein
MRLLVRLYYSNHIYAVQMHCPATADLEFENWLRDRDSNPEPCG